MKILHIASEAVPWAKTGGLADVAGSLCRHLAGAGHSVTLALPLYRSIREAGHDVGAVELELRIDDLAARVRMADAGGGLRVLFIDVPELFDREGLYGTGEADHPDNPVRFSAFVRFALRGAAMLDLRPQVVHCHDWQAALTPLYVRDGWLAPPDAPAAGGAPPVVLTVHNLAYQGAFAPSVADRAGLPPSAAGSAVTPHMVNFLRGGLLAADRVTTVSPRYAAEIATPVHGCGLEGVIADLKPPVTGILNGIDTDEWDPASDPHLGCAYDADDPAGKAACKRILQEEMGLPPEPDVPLFGMISRLVDQKGLGLIESAGDDLARRPAQFVFLGTGEARYERYLVDLADRHPNVAARVAFSEPVSHRIEAGADFFLMPSAFEPCGLNQMISQRYGTVPVVHRVGGLADSVSHATPDAVRAGKATGVVFDHFDAPALTWAVDFALELYADRTALAAVRRAGMRRDFSWAGSGRRYEALYLEALEARHGED